MYIFILTMFIKYIVASKIVIHVVFILFFSIVVGKNYLIDINPFTPMCNGQIVGYGKSYLKSTYIQHFNLGFIFSHNILHYLKQLIFTLESREATITDSRGQTCGTE